MNNNTVQDITAALSAALFALLGVDYYSLLWGAIGAFYVLFQNETPMGRLRSTIYVTLATLVGAALGTAGGAAIGSESRALLNVLSLIGGFGSQKIVSTLLQSVVTRLTKKGETP